MSLNCVKLGRAISNVNFNLEQDHVPCIKYTEFCTAGGK